MELEQDRSLKVDHTIDVAQRYGTVICLPVFPERRYVKPYLLRGKLMVVTAV